jgi:hypothetical protein
LCKVYLNGIIGASFNGNGAFPSIPNNITLGCNYPSLSNFFKGYMRNFFVVNSVLSDSQIMNMYTSTKFF